MPPSKEGGSDRPSKEGNAIGSQTAPSAQHEYFHDLEPSGQPGRGTLAPNNMLSQNSAKNSEFARLPWNLLPGGVPMGAKVGQYVGVISNDSRSSIRRNL